MAAKGSFWVDQRNPRRHADLRSPLLRITVGVFSVSVSFFIASRTEDFRGDGYLFTLPLLYGILFCALPNLWDYRRGHLGMAVLNIVIFCRYTIAPLLRAISIDAPTVRGVTPSSTGVHAAIIIMAVELVVTFTLVQLFAPRLYKARGAESGQVARLGSKSILTVTLLLGVTLAAAFPGILGRYNFFIITDPVERLSLDIPLSGLFVLVVDLVLVILPILLLDYFKRKYDASPRFTYVLLSLLSILPAVTVFRGTSRFSVLIPTLAFLVILLRLYPKYRVAIAATLGSVLLVVFFSITLYKQFGYTQGSALDADLSTNELAYNFDAYMSGPDNLARVVDMEASGRYDIDLRTLFNDATNNIALISTLADSRDTTPAMFNHYLYGHHRTADQIIPLSGQSYLHFGDFGTPALIAVTIVLMMYFDNKIRMETRIEYVYIYSYITVYLAMGMMVSYGSIYPLFLNLVLPVAVIFGANRRAGRRQVAP